MIGRSGRGPRPRPLLRTMLGDVLRRIRREQGRTLADVARAAKVSMPYLSEVERGRKEASSEVLVAICDALHIELSDLLAEVGHDLAGRRAGRRAGRASVIRLAVIPGRPDAPPAPGPADAQCLLAA
jgi:transcriptional regulator with XRE-family HTH domain